MPDNSSAYLEDIASLEEMRAALLRFQNDADNAVKSAQREITAALDGLQDRLHYWQRQLSKRQDALAQAKNELARCLSFRGPHGEGADCSAFAAAVRQAEQKVQEAQQAIRTAQIHIKRVEEGNARFQSQAHRFITTLTSTELPKATALLRKSIAILESYISQMIPPVGRFASRAGRIAASLSAAGLITVAAFLWPIDITTELPVPTDTPAFITFSEGARQGAKQTEEVVDDVRQAEEKKEAIKKSFQQDQHGTVQPEKL